MADALVEPRPAVRFFCHRCSIEFEDVLQDYTCPYCAGGFIEQLETEADGLALSGDDFSDADMSTIDDISNLEMDMGALDDPDGIQHSAPPMLNDLAFLMSGGRLRGHNGGAGGGAGAGAGGHRRHTLMEELVWMIGGARSGSGAVTAGAPFVLVGAPGDYVFGGEGLDAVVTQLLGQLENAGPPPLPRERLAALPDEPVTEEQASANTACSVCWDNFSLGETVCRLECEHIFHSACIRPWLQLHATCPICRRSLLPEEPAPPTAPRPASSAAPRPIAVPAPAPAPVASAPTSAPATSTSASSTGTNPTTALASTLAAAIPRVFLQRIVPGLSLAAPDPLWQSAASSGSGLSSSVSVSSAPSWGPQTTAASTGTTGTTNSTSSLNSDRERQYNMDLDYD